jgi:pimeloyl-ACP methyl ester carboxylesterase
MMNEFKFKPVDSRITEHTVERRGFVSVPFDYSAGETSPRIEIFYRLIPSEQGSLDDVSKPIIVVVNGGPGIPSSAYRPLEFDYQDSASSKNGPLNRFKYLLKTHRVLIADQRGTAGNSAPLDMDDPKLDPDAVAKMFSSDSQARDYLAVIEAVIPKGEKFFMIAQSYGGMVGMQYLSLPNARVPGGIIFSSSAIPYENPMDSMVDRRQEQLNLNVQLKKAVPGIREQIEKLKSHLASLGINRDQVNGLYGWLGKGVTGTWEAAFAKRVDELSSATREVLHLEFKNTFDETHLLNYILSSANFTPGHTDRTMALETAKLVPYEDWMIDENWVALQTGQAGGPSSRWVAQMDRTPPKPTPFASVEKIRECIHLNQLLFTAADNDAYVPAVAYHRAIEKFLVPGHTAVKTISGGHNAIFLEEGHQTFLAWSTSLK